MPRNIPALKSRELVRILAKGQCVFYRQGRGDHSLYVRIVKGQKRIVPIDMGTSELSPPYVLRILRQLGFADDEIEALLKK